MESTRSLQTQILKPTSKNIEFLVEELKSEAVVGLPTETVYGLAGLSTSERSIQQIFQVKKRPFFDPLIVHIPSFCKTTADLVAFHLMDPTTLSPECINKIDLLITKFWPGPLTLVVPKHSDISLSVTSGLSQVGIRMPSHPVSQMVLESLKMPLAAPSANRFGRISPTTPEAVLQELGGQIPWILDGGRCSMGVESTIVSISSQAIHLLRPGAISLETLEKALGEQIQVPSPHTAQTLSPGVFKSHYAPQKPFWVLPNEVIKLKSEDISLQISGLKKGPLGLLLFSSESEKAAQHFSALTQQPVLVRCLNKNKSIDLQEAAYQLFYEMRALDDSEATAIFSEPCPSKRGLGRAILDRLSKASHPLR